MKRRDFHLTALAALLALGLHLDPAAAQEPKTGGSLTWGIETEAATLNPHRNGQDKTKLYLRNTYESLLYRTADAGYVPWLAKSYTVSPDGLTYTFTLRDDVKFTDGEALNAEAVVKNFEAVQDPAYAPSIAQGPAAKLASVRALDEHTVELKLKQIYAPFLDFAGSLDILSPQAFASEELQAGGPKIAGTGPFILKDYQKGQQLHYVRNPDYHWPPATAANQGPAYLDEVTYRILPESAVRSGALQSGQLDVIEGISGNDASIFRDDPQFTYQTAFNTGTPYSLFLNVEHGPTQDVKVRQAVQAAIDLASVIPSVYRGERTRAWGITTPIDSQFYDAKIEGSYGFDPARANQLLDEAGWTARDAEGYRTKDGKRLTIEVIQAQATVRDQRDVLLQALQAQAKQNAGIDLAIVYVDAGTYTERRKTGVFGGIANSNTPTDAVDIEYHYLPLSEGGTINYSRASDPELKEWLVKASGTLDQKERFALYSKLQDFALKDRALALPLYVPEDQVAAASYVQGISFRPFKQLPENAQGIWLDK
ncbi:ABC transporter substrate-binding protein [Paracoccus aminophilus]|uniref:ABC-type dipeptide transport system, periplasmic component n=1 Tax=Paracoccus aminophilus JCM 7686 TaxID=1367847 RepID=S5Z063_PARAH|nr:ABC transporter substrate-binding protein [Paracoccus aminophilus]AGT10866.1 ABC-type dipeptide transport system, periplasmic component [Paracoccus aminophilus JCM 7686]